MAKTKVKKEEKEVIEIKKKVKFLCPSCNHPEEVHYGGRNGNCNVTNCECQEFK